MGWNAYINAHRAPLERSIAVLKVRWRALKHITFDPTRIGALAAAALVLTQTGKPTEKNLLSTDQRCYNAVQRATRAPPERGNALLKATLTALRHVSIGPKRIGAMTTALVIPHTEHHRTV